MQQIAVGGVDFDGLDAEQRCAAGCLDEVLAHQVHAVPVQRDGRIVAGRVRQRRRCHGLPAALGGRRDLQAPLPRHVAGRLASRMCQLHRHRNARIGAHGGEHLGERRGIVFVVQPETAGCDASVRRDGGGLDGQQPRTRQRELTQVDGMPVGGRPLARRVLAHGGDDDTVRQRQIADREGGEKTTHG